MTIEKSLSVGDVAKIFKVTPYTIRKWINGDEENPPRLKAFKPSGRDKGHWRILESEVVRLANEMYGRSK